MNNWKQIARMESERQRKLNLAIQLIKQDGLSVQRAAQVTGVTVSEINRKVKALA